MIVGVCSISDIITFDQNWHHLLLSSARRKDLSNDTQIRVIGSIEHEICTKMLRNLSEKLGAKFPSTTLGYRYSVVRISLLDDAFTEILELEASSVVGQQLQHKDRKRRKRKRKKN